jgi:hypothetical protein
MKWYTTTKKDDRQGLVCDETTGQNIAVTYDPAHAAIVAAAPELLEALEDAIDVAGNWGEDGDPSWLVRAKEAIQKAKGEA